MDQDQHGCAARLVRARPQARRLGPARTLEDAHLPRRASLRRGHRALRRRRAAALKYVCLVNGIRFAAYVDQVMIAALKLADVVTPDNLGSHKGAVRAAVRAIRKFGVTHDYVFLMREANLPYRSLMRDELVWRLNSEARRIMQDFLFIALGLGSIAALGLYASALSRV